MNPDTMTLTELRDWHAQDEGWHCEPNEVKGKLPKTKDGVVVMPGETVWNYDQWHNHSTIQLVPNGRYGAFFGQQWRPIECCFAEHSAAAKAAEAARGEK